MKQNSVGNKEVRQFICEGFGKRYEVEATYPGYARLKAASLFKEETGRQEPASLLAAFFSPRVVNPRRPGKNPNWMKEVFKVGQN